MKTRKEYDSIGEIKVPVDKYWGASTQRSKKYFDIGEFKVRPVLIKSIAIIKKSAAIVHKKGRQIDAKIANAIIKASENVISGKLDDHFPLKVWQTGSGTQTNMNVNEVIANKSNQLLGRKLPTNTPLHPNDHINRSQSSNDSIPTAMHIATVLSIQKILLPEIAFFKKSLKKKISEFKGIIKIGRTHTQDATPIKISNEFLAFYDQISYAENVIKKSLDKLYELAQGGTAVGTGINTSTKFIKGFIKAIQIITNLPFKESKNKFEALSSHEPIIFFSSSINTLVIACYKISNDIRLLASGPRCGIGELVLPSNEPGSSIMPGKVNPTQSEAVTMVCVKVIGNHNGITMAGSHGHFELNVFKPLIAHNILQSIEIMADSSKTFALYCVKGIKADKKRIQQLLDSTLMLVTALAPKIGYDKAAKIAKTAHKNGTTLKEEVLKEGILTEKDYDKIMNPLKMTKPK